MSYSQCTADPTRVESGFAGPFSQLWACYFEGNLKLEPVAFGNILGRRPKILWVVSSGGHLTQALKIEAQVGQNLESLWITNESKQATSALAGRRRELVPYVAPRDIRGANRSRRIVGGALRREYFDFVVSTGAAIAVLALPYAALLGTSVVYIESVARRNGPSVTGTVLSFAPKVRTFSQNQFSGNRRWITSESVFRGWSVHASSSIADTDRPLKLLVTLGTIKPYTFDRAVRAVSSIVSDSDEIVWQLGVTPEISGMPGEVHSSLSNDDVRKKMDWADVVITHSGVGTALEALDCGKMPVLVVRSAEHGEHVDNHQDELATSLVESGLGYRLDLENPTRDVLLEASCRKIEPAS